MAAPVKQIPKPNRKSAELWLEENHFQQFAGCWMSSNRWARITPLLRGRVSITVGVTT